LDCSQNDLTSLDVSNNTSLERLLCSGNELTSLDLTNNFVLKGLLCYRNNLTSLDIINNTAIETLYCAENNLTSLNIKNGNNKNIVFNAIDNRYLYCIQVDDSAWSANADEWYKDDHAHYSEDCGYTGVEEFLTEGTEVFIIPNPFSQSTAINYQLTTPSQVGLKVYDTLGIEVATPVNKFQDAGDHQAVFDGNGLAPGLYYYTIQIGGSVESGKMVLVR